MKYKDGWAFPDADEFMVRELAADGSYQFANLQAALHHVTDFRLAIDGGAHVGTWSKVMSGAFQAVIAVEPSRDTYECLCTNLAAAGCRNVTPINLALGSGSGSVRMVLDPVNEERANTGARHVEHGGEIPVEAIDSWALPHLGFLKLDIEGSEYVALMGATQTLERCKPIVLFENKRLWSRYYGLPKGVVQNFLTVRGYHLLERVSRDEIWGPA